MNESLFARCTKPRESGQIVEYRDKGRMEFNCRNSNNYPPGVNHVFPRCTVYVIRSIKREGGILHWLLWNSYNYIPSQRGSINKLAFAWYFLFRVINSNLLLSTRNYFTCTRYICIYIYIVWIRWKVARYWQKIRVIFNAMYKVNPDAMFVRWNGGIFYRRWKGTLEFGIERGLFGLV